MPIYSCGDGTFRIGDGECMYTSRASVERAYVAYLAQENDDKKAIDMNKVSFDFDDTLTQERWQNKAIMLKEEGKTVYIVTRRQDKQNDAVYAIADKIGVPRSRVYFTNGKMKWETIKRLGIGTHYDNNEDEIKLIRENTEAKGILVQEKNNSMIYNYKSFEANVKDVDSKKGEVSGYFSAFGMVDSDGDIMMPGAFKRSIQDWGPEAKGRVKHLLNHDPSQPLGKIVELKEDSYGLYYRSQVGSHRLGQDFIKMVESGLIGEHSIGFRTLREQKSDSANEIHEVMLFEGSSLTAWGANEYTPILGIKSLEQSAKIQEQIKSFEKFIRNSDVTDETIELCLIKVRQLAQAIEKTSSTKAVEETPAQQKNNEELEQTLISILRKF
jgi:HK97 family phage prohead protease